MSAECPEQEDLDKFFTVFDGSSPEDVSHARRLWSSLSLLPPLESRLESADIRQRLPVSRPQRTGPKHPEPRQRQDDREGDRQRCVSMSQRRTELHRESRGPRGSGKEKMLKHQKPSDSEMDRQLQ